MASRINRKFAALPAKQNAAVKISRFRELPGAVFFGDINPWDVEHATRLQQISSEYEACLQHIRTAHATRLQRRAAREDATFFLRHDLLEMGFDFERA